MITLLWLSMTILLGSGLAALGAGRNNTVASGIASGGVIIAAVVGSIPAFQVLTTGHAMTASSEWQIPFGSWSIYLDPLSAFFIVMIFIISALCSLYGIGYLKGDHDNKSIAAAWFFTNLLVASMIMVCLAANAVLFLLAWELMALSSFFLVMFDFQEHSVRRAGWVYLVAAHLGTAALLAMFMIHGKYSGSLEFATFAGTLPGPWTDICFVLALIGFGTKAGIMPFHVWLPEAHPAAPSHISAIMSGVMIKTGIYALLRFMTFSSPWPQWWGIMLVSVGIVSMVLGVLFALAQRNLKRLLAYCSVENIGIIFCGLGIGMLGLNAGIPIVALLGFTGAIVHMVNHALYKGLLFLGGGSVFKETGTLEIDALGGVLKRMPVTGLTFLAGSVAIAGLPPFNGFISEFIIFLAMGYGIIKGSFFFAVIMAMAIIALALSSGLAAACFTKAFGVIFLGEPRSVAAAHESPVSMTMPMAVLAVFCFALGLMGPWLTLFLGPIITLFVPDTEPALTGAAGFLKYISLGSLVFILLVSVLALIRNRWQRDNTIGREVTWDCGFSAPTSRMQYTGSSFVQPLTDLFRFILRTKKHITTPDAYAPAPSSLQTETQDVSRESMYKPFFYVARHWLSAITVLQRGKIQIYLLYLVLTLLGLLLWNLW